MVPVNQSLYTGTFPMNNLQSKVGADKFLYTGTVPVNNLLFTRTLSRKWSLWIIGYMLGLSPWIICNPQEHLQNKSLLITFYILGRSLWIICYSQVLFLNVVPVKYLLYTGTVLVNNLLFTGTLSKMVLVNNLSYIFRDCSLLL